MYSVRGRALLRDHGGAFSPATVELHRVSAENYAGDPGAAVAAALRIVPARPAVHDLVSGLLVTGRTGPELPRDRA